MVLSEVTRKGLGEEIIVQKKCELFKKKTYIANISSKTAEAESLW